MSSFISKSKKAFKPKAPQARRTETSASGTPSVRSSQEPQRQTPQPTSRSSVLNDAAAQALNVASHSQNQTRPAVPRSVQQENTTSNADNSAESLHRGLAAADPLPTPAPTQSTGLQDGQEQASTGPQERPESPQTARRTRKQVGAVPIHAPAAPITPESTPAQAPANVTVPIPVADETREQGATALLQLSQEARRDETDQDAQSNRAENQQSPAKKKPRLTRHRGSKTGAAAGTDEQGTSANGVAQSTGRRRTRAQLAVSDNANQSPASTQPQSRRNKRTQKGGQTGGPEQESTNQPAAVDGPKKRQKADATKKSGPRSQAQQPVEDQVDAIVEAATSTTRKRGSRKRKAADTENGNGDSEAENSEHEEHKSSPRRKRAKTPDDAEQTSINAETQVLGELPNIRIGRLGPRELKLRERDEQLAAEDKEKRQAKARADLEEFMDIPEGEERDKAREEKAEREAREKEEAQEREDRERVWQIEDEGEWSFKPRGRWGTTKKSGEDDEDETAGNAAQVEANGDTANGEREDSPFVNVFQSTGAGFRIVDGNIVADPNARALEAPTSTTVMEERVETDIDRRVTGASFAHREPRGRWDATRTSLFYEGLRRWGTDFGMVATWVPGMSRNQVKRKYTQEEKLNPELVLDALRKENRIATTLAEIQEKRGRPLRDPKEWQADMDRREGEMRAKAQADKAQADELLRNRGNVQEKQGQQDQQHDGDQEEGEDGGEAEGSAAADDDDGQIENESHQDTPRQSIETGDQAGGGAASPSAALAIGGSTRGGRGGRNRGGRARARGGRGAVNPHIVNMGMP